MLFRSVLCRRNSACLTIVLVVIAAGLVSSAPQRAHAGKRQTSPFAGHYGCHEFFHIDIDRRGQIDGLTVNSEWITVKFKGRIWNDGAFQLAATEEWPDGPIRYTVTGFGALDEFGNLYGVWDYPPDGSVHEFYWFRCN